MLKLFPDPGETIEGVGLDLRAGRTTCVKVLDHCFHQIDLWDARVNAWVVVDRAGAMRQARALDEDLAGGKCRGPLHGIPFGIKDIIDVQGLPTAAGFSPWRERVAERDAHVVERLRFSGALILGKTVTTQFAWIDPPPTRNPWNLDRTPGGSSSGSAAAVATGMCLGAIGTQTGGSIIRPASFCGVAGLKPAYYEVNTRGIVPFAPSLDHAGPIARTTRDLSLMFYELYRWGRDLDGYTHSDRGHVDGLVAERLAAPQAPPGLIRLRGFFDRRAEPAMTAMIDRAVAALTRAGAEVADVPDDDFELETILDRHRVIMAAEAAAEHESRLLEHPGAYSPRIRALVEEGLAIPLTRYVRDHLEWQQRVRPRTVPGDVSTRNDAFLVPATVGPAPDLSTTGDPAFNAPWSYLGWPAVSFPVGLSDEGLPLALQLIGSPLGGGRGLLTTASWCEDAIRRASRAGSL